MSKKPSDPAPEADAVQADAIYGSCAPNLIRKSSENRKRFDESALQELAASVKAKGVLQPILVRPVVPTPDEPQELEIVAGERRWRASIIAELDSIPYICRAMSDLEAAEIRILENLQREDPHELEEAEGYERLMQKHGYDVDQLATQIHKSRSYIYGRLKLCALTPIAREMFFEGKLTASTALLVARIPIPVLQIEAMKTILQPAGPESEAMSYRKASDFIQSRYMLDLNKAVFSITDAKLLAAAGSCTKCPKRTGNQPEVFEGISADVCTDPDCYAEKRAANDHKIIVVANKKGIPVFDGDEGEAKLRKTLNYDSDVVTNSKPLWAFERSLLPSGTVEKLPLDAYPAPVGYVKSKNGTVTALYDKTQMQLALESAGICETVEAEESRDNLAHVPTDAEKKAQEKQAERSAQLDADRLEAKKQTEFRVALYKLLRQRGATGFSLESLREFAKLVLLDDNNYSLPDDLLGDLYGLNDYSDETVIAYIDQASLPEIQLILVDLVLGECLQIDSYDLDDMDDEHNYKSVQFKALSRMARAEGIDPDEVAEELCPTVINVKTMTKPDVRHFIVAHPTRINDLKGAIIADAPHLVGELEKVSQDLGLIYSMAGTLMRPEDSAEAKRAAADALAKAAHSEIETGTEDAEGLADMMRAEEASDPVKSKVKNKKASPAPKIQKNPKPDQTQSATKQPWPWPTSATCEKDAQK